MCSSIGIKSGGNRGVSNQAFDCLVHPGDKTENKATVLLDSSFAVLYAVSFPEESGSAGESGGSCNCLYDSK